MRHSLALLTFWLATQCAMADFVMPKYVYRMNELDKAQAEAQAKGEPLAFIYTHEQTTCGLCRSASLNAADRLKGKAVLVYANCDSEWNQIPAVVQDAIHSPQAGKYVPITVLVEGSLKTVLTTIPYALDEEQNKLIKAALRTLPKQEAAPAITAPATAAPITRNAVREARIWTSRTGSTLEATLLQQNGAYLVLQTAEGKQMQIMATQLSDADQRYLAQLRAP